MKSNYRNLLKKLVGHTIFFFKKLPTFLIFFACFEFLYPNKINSTEYFWTCTNNQDGFLSIFKLKVSNPLSITHISSFDSISGKKYSVNSPLQIISSNNNFIISADFNVEDYFVIDVFDLKQKILLSNGINFDETPPDLQVYKCD